MRHHGVGLAQGRPLATTGRPVFSAALCHSAAPKAAQDTMHRQCSIFFLRQYPKVLFGDVVNLLIILSRKAPQSLCAAEALADRHHASAADPGALPSISFPRCLGNLVCKP